ncbi:adaptor protein MecA [Heyndrickxia sporothermodurans]|uniref:adaptor protein MecA n=1 Tax=Heyndrickxia sporothermodurans TaxID=46224 RepID=UPI0035D84872
MKLERISQNKIKYSITFEELLDKGLHEEEFESFIWYELFDEMVEIAKQKYQCDIPDTISIEIFSLNSSEIVLILTMDELSLQEENQLKPFLSTKSCYSIFIFESIEDVITLAFYLENLQLQANSKLILFEDQYFLILPFQQPVSIICEEFGEKTNLSVYMLEEYGTTIIDHDALQILANYFKR